MLLAQKGELEEREATVTNQEASHQANVATADARLRQEHDEQEAENRKTLAESLQKQKDGTYAEFKQELALQETRFQERNKVLKAKCSGLEKQLESMKDSVEGARYSVSASEKAREEAEKAREVTEKKRGDLQAELKCLKTQHTRLVETSEKQNQELLQREGQRNTQCVIFKGVYDRLLGITGMLGMTLSGSIDFQADDVDSYASFFRGFVA